MEEITLEKIDLIRERMNVSYNEAKEALENCAGNVVDTLIYLETVKTNTKENMIINKEDFTKYIKELIQKGRATRLKIKKQDKVLLDIPINAAIAAGIAGIIYPVLLAIGFMTAMSTKITIEITKPDGSVEVVNKIIKNTVDDVKEKVQNIGGDIKFKVNDISSDIKEKIKDRKSDNEVDYSNSAYKYTVKFDENGEAVTTAFDENNKKNEDTNI